MKTKQIGCAVLVMLICSTIVFGMGNKTKLELPKMKMTTKIPPGIATPDKLQTRIGTLNLVDGVPDKATVQKVYDYLDFQHGVQAFMNGIQIASMDGLRKGILGFGPRIPRRFFSRISWTPRPCG